MKSYYFLTHWTLVRLIFLDFIFISNMDLFIVLVEQGSQKIAIFVPFVSMILGFLVILGTSIPCMWWSLFWVVKSNYTAYF